MEPEKAEFKRLIELMGWSQSEAARHLHKTPSAINHLLNPNHSNRPTPTTMQLLKLIIAREQPSLADSAFEMNETSGAAKPSPRFSAREWSVIERIRRLPPGEQNKVYAVIDALLSPKGAAAKKR